MHRFFQAGALVFAQLILVAAVASGCGGGHAHFKADENPAVTGETFPEEATCPVMGEKFKPTKESQFSVYEGKKVYFCCPGCKGKFDADPAKYMKAAAPAAPAAAAPAATPAPAAAAPAAAGEVTCLISGEKFVPTAESPKSEYKGKTFTFCCAGCKKKFDAEPEKYASKDPPAKPDCKGDCGGDCDDKKGEAKK